jgi:hemolysin III
VKHLTTAAPKPVLRGWFHAVASLSAVPAGLVLAYTAKHPVNRLAAAVFATTMAATFGISAVYHRMARSERAQRIWQRLDHAGIYLLIAGSYVPVCLVVLPRSIGVPLLVVVVAAACTGVALRLFAFERGRIAGGVLYVTMGWAVLFTAPELVERLRPAPLVLLVVGGVLYTVGVPVLVVRRPDPWPRVFGYHEVWHTLTVLAAGAHFAAVAMMV